MLPLDIKTNFANDTIAGLLKLSGNMAVGCTGNSNFTFAGTSLADFKTAQTKWATDQGKNINDDTELAAVALGSRKLMEPLMTAICEQVNTQAKNDKAKLISSGGELTSEGGPVGPMPKAVVKKYEFTGVKGELKITIDTFEQSIGTYISITDVANKTTVVKFYSTKHTILVKGLTPGLAYSITAAHASSDADAGLNNSSAIEIWAQ